MSIKEGVQVTFSAEKRLAYGALKAPEPHRRPPAPSSARAFVRPRLRPPAPYRKMPFRDDLCLSPLSELSPMTPAKRPPSFAPGGRADVLLRHRRGRLRRIYWPRMAGHAAPPRLGRRRHTAPGHPSERPPQDGQSLALPERLLPLSLRKLVLDFLFDDFLRSSKSI